MIAFMIKKLTEEPRKWTPILSAISAVGTTLVGALIAIIGWFLIHTLDRIDSSLKSQVEKIEIISEKFHDNKSETAERLGKVEIEVKFLDTRVDRLENKTRMVKNEGNS